MRLSVPPCGINAPALEILEVFSHLKDSCCLSALGGAGSAMVRPGMGVQTHPEVNSPPESSLG